ncbi:MAG: nucleoside phosphorylase [Acidimicrobiales bacterium]
MGLPLEEFDPDPDAAIDPGRHRGRAELPPRAVICFFDEVVRAAVGDRPPDYRLKWEHGFHGVWALDGEGGPLTVCHPGCTAPLAGANLDVLVALGCDRIIACGGAGTVAAGFDLGHPVIVTDAVRDEGTSYHYLPAGAGRTVAASPAAIAALEETLTEAGVPYELGRTWTTDAVFRETRAKVARRRAEGCLTVEMEAAALFAVAAFRGATIGQLLYCGDDLSTDTWDHRGWDRDTAVRRRIFELACRACLRL